MEVLKLMGGIALFLFGMKVMSNSLEKLAGSRLKKILGSMTSNIAKGFAFGLIVTAAIQSSAATIVMVVGFVNSGLMTLFQATGVIMGANIGTSVTGWIVSLSGIKGSDQIYYGLAFVGIVLYWFFKKQKIKNIGEIILGFSILMIGMQTMSASVSGLKDAGWFMSFLKFLSNPILGLLFGIVFTAIIQSSSASVGVIQSFAAGFALPFSFCIPYVMGANIGTCSTALISSIGASKEAKRTALIHLLYNVLATVIILPVYCILLEFADVAFFSQDANAFGIAIANTVIKIAELILMIPCASLLRKLACLIAPDKPNDKDKTSLLDERLLETPAAAIETTKTVTVAMAELAVESMKIARELMQDYSEDNFETVSEYENTIDGYEDKIGSYLIKLSSKDLSENENREVSKLLRLIGDFERISDHSKNISESAKELHEKKIVFSKQAEHELITLSNAVDETLGLAMYSFKYNDCETAALVEPLEQVVDELKNQIRSNHIVRLQRGECTNEHGFILTDILTDLERVSDHCSNIALCVIEIANGQLDLHKYINELKKNSGGFDKLHESYELKYSIQ